MSEGEAKIISENLQRVLDEQRRKEATLALEGLPKYDPTMNRHIGSDGEINANALRIRSGDDIFSKSLKSFTIPAVKQRIIIPTFLNK